MIFQFAYSTNLNSANVPCDSEGNQVAADLKRAKFASTVNKIEEILIVIAFSFILLFSLSRDV